MLESGATANIRRRADTTPDPPVRPPARDAQSELVNRFAQVPGPAVIVPRRLRFLTPPRQVEPSWPGTRGRLA